MKKTLLLTVSILLAALFIYVTNPMAVVPVWLAFAVYTGK